MKRILTVQDISCVGKCSLTVALPVVSACGVETCVLPTALLSTHTAFRHHVRADLTDRFQPITAAWRAEGILFDGLYSGYLGSEAQVEEVRAIYGDFCRPGSLFFVDPVMADQGKMYAGFSASFAAAMRSLCAAADVIVPNVSEACFLLDRPYTKEELDEEEIKEILTSLCALGCRCAVVTGVRFKDDRIGFYGYDAEKKSFFSYATPRVPAFFPGTGDVFASSAFGALERGLSAPEAMRLAADFTYRSILATTKEETHNWYGVDFESALPSLTRQIETALDQKEGR